MAWTEQDLREIEDELKKGSQGGGDIAGKRKKFGRYHLCPHIK